MAAVLTDSIDPAAYWRKLKQRLKKEGNETVTNCHGLKLQTADSDFHYNTNDKHLIRQEWFFTKCKKQVFDQQFSENLDSADFGKLVLHIVIDKAVMRQRAAASLLGA